MEGERGYRYLDDNEFIGFLEGQRVIGQFPCSMSVPWFFLNSIFSLTIISVLIVLVIWVPVVALVTIMTGFENFLFPVIGLGLLTIFLWSIFLVQAPKLFKEWISGNKVKLTDEGIQFFMRPYAKGPIFRNFVPYEHVMGIGKARQDCPPASMILRIVGPMGYSFSSLFKEGQLFIPNTKKSGLLTIRFDEPMSFRFGGFNYFNAMVENFPLVEEGSTINRKFVMFKTVHFDVEAKYHSKFLEVFNKLKQKKELGPDNGPSV